MVVSTIVVVVVSTIVVVCDLMCALSVCFVCVVLYVCARCQWAEYLEEFQQEGEDSSSPLTLKKAKTFNDVAPPLRPGYRWIIDKDTPEEEGTGGASCESQSDPLGFVKQGSWNR